MLVYVPLDDDCVLLNTISHHMITKCKEPTYLMYARTIPRRQTGELEGVSNGEAHEAQRMEQ